MSRHAFFTNDSILMIYNAVLWDSSRGHLWFKAYWSCLSTSDDTLIWWMAILPMAVIETVWSLSSLPAKAALWSCNSMILSYLWFYSSLLVVTQVSSQVENVVKQEINVFLKQKKKESFPLSEQHQSLFCAFILIQSSLDSKQEWGMPGFSP